MGRILVVANETLQAEAVDEVVRAQLAAGHRVHFVVPLRIPVYADLGGLSMYGFVSLEAGDAAAIETDAQARLDEVLDRLAADGLHATGRIHSVDPLNAVERELARRPAEEIVLSTKARALSRWLGVDLPRRLARRFPEVHVTTLENRVRELVGAR